MTKASKPSTQVQGNKFLKKTPQTENKSDLVTLNSLSWSKPMSFDDKNLEICGLESQKSVII